MDPTRATLLEALKTGAAHPGELRLYRSGKLPGLLPTRTRANAAVAAEALRDGLIEIARTETKGRTTTEWVRVTPKGVEFILQHESPARALDELRDALKVNGDNLPAWVAELRQELDGLSRRFLGEVERIAGRLEQLSQRVEEVLRRKHAGPAPVAWAELALEFLAGRRELTGQPQCPLPELFAALTGRAVELNLRDFHAGLRQMREQEQVRLWPFEDNGGPAEPEYALLDGAAVFWFVSRS